MRPRRVAATESARISSVSVTVGVSQCARGPARLRSRQTGRTASVHSFASSSPRFFGSGPRACPGPSVRPALTRLKSPLFPFLSLALVGLTRFSVTSTQIPRGKTHLPNKATSSLLSVPGNSGCAPVFNPGSGSHLDSCLFLYLLSFQLLKNNFIDF